MVFGAVACSQPDTDIVWTNTEHVGGYDVVATRDGDTLHASVCLSRADSADGVVRRVHEQLQSHGYKSMTFDVYTAPERPVKRIVWSGASDTTQPLTAPPPNHFCQTSGERIADAAEP